MSVGDDRRKLEDAAVDHFTRHVENDRKSDVGDPAMPLQESADQVGGDAHEGDRKDQTESENEGVIARRAGDGEHIVE